MESGITESRRREAEVCVSKDKAGQGPGGPDWGENVRRTENGDRSQWKRGGEWPARLPQQQWACRGAAKTWRRGGEGSSGPRGGQSHVWAGPRPERALRTEGAGAGWGSVPATSHQRKVSSVLVALGRNEWKHRGVAQDRTMFKAPTNLGLLCSRADSWTWDSKRDFRDLSARAFQIQGLKKAGGGKKLQKHQVTLLS